MIERYKFSEAPVEYRLASTFARDKLCEEVDLWAGDDYDEVFEATSHHFFATPGLADFDISNDNVSGFWIGVTCQDV